MEQLIEKIKVALADRNVSVVAANLNMSPHTIYKIINSQHKRGPIPANAYRLADYLGVERDGTSN